MYKKIRPTNVWRSVSAALILLFASSGANADEFLDGKPLLKDAVSTSAGLELILPLIDEVDNTGDGYPDQIFVKFNVFTAGTTNRLFDSTPRGFVPPSIPCTTVATGSLDWDWDITFVGEDNTHTGLGLLFYTECFDESDGQFKEAIKTLFYMADTRSNSGISWAQAWPWDALGFEIVNWDGDAQEEVVIYLANENDVTGRAEARPVILRKADGTPESDRRYTILRVFD